MMQDHQIYQKLIFYIVISNYQIINMFQYNFQTVNTKFKKQMSQLPIQPQDNISIEIDPAIFDKPDSQLTEQLYEMARRIAESDRNNQAYRQAKKSKSFELETLKSQKQELQSQLDKLDQEIGVKKNIENENNFTKNNRVKFEEINTLCQSLVNNEKQVQKNTCDLIKQNEKLQKKLAVLQVQYQIMLKQNKHKSAIISKLSKQKQQKLQTIEQNHKKIQQLETQCQETKRRAQELEHQLKQQFQTEHQLQQLTKQREQQLETQRREKEQTSKKQEESKRVLMKMINSVKGLESQIQQKFREGDRLQGVHEMLKQKIGAMESQQKKLEEFINSRRNVLANLKTISGRVSKQEEALNRLQANRVNHSE